jgi:hypothetical protein
MITTNMLRCDELRVDGEEKHASGIGDSLRRQYEQTSLAVQEALTVHIWSGAWLLYMSARKSCMRASLAFTGEGDLALDNSTPTTYGTVLHNTHWLARRRKLLAFPKGTPSLKMDASIIWLRRSTTGSTRRDP